MNNARKRITIPTVLSEIAKPVLSKPASPKSTADTPGIGSSSISKNASKSYLDGRDGVRGEDRYPEYYMPNFVAVCRNEHLVKNIWYANLPSIIPCRFIAFNSKTGYVTVEIDFLTEQKTIFRLSVTVNRMLFINNSEEELSLPERPDQQLIASEKAVGSYEYISVNSYYNNTAFRLTLQHIRDSYGQYAADDYTKEYELSLTHCSAKFYLDEQDSLHGASYRFGYGNADEYTCCNRCDVKRIAVRFETMLRFYKSYYLEDCVLINPLIQQIYKIIYCYIYQVAFSDITEQIVDRLKVQIEKLQRQKQQLQTLDPSSIISGIYYRGQSIERKGKAQQILAGFLEQMQPFNGVIIYSHFDSIVKYFSVAYDRSKAWETNISMLWNTIIPFLFFLSAGVLHYTLIQHYFELTLTRLYQGLPLNVDFVVFTVEYVYLLFLRSFYSKAINILRDFQVGIERNILHVDDKAERKQKFAELVTSYLYYQLLHINFGTDAENYDLSPFKQYTSIYYSISTNCQPQQSPSIEELQYYLYAKISKVYSLFFMLPLVSSQDFSYSEEGWRYNGYIKLSDIYSSRDAQPKADLLAYFTFQYQLGNVSSYEFLLTAYGQNNTARGSKSRFPCISIQSENSIILEMFDQKLDQISSVLAFAYNCLNEFCIESFFYQPKYQFYQLSQTQKIQELVARTPSVEALAVIDYQTFFMWDYLQKIVVYFDTLKGYIHELPDFVYYFLVRLDFSIFKQQAVNLVDQYIYYYREAAMELYCKTETYLLNNVTLLDVYLYKKITPDLLVSTYNLIAQLNGFDVKYHFEMLYRVEFEVPMILIDIFEVSFGELDYKITYSFIKLIYEKNAVLARITQQHLLFKYLIRFVTQWYEKMAKQVVEYFHELSKLYPDDIIDARQYPHKFRQNYKLITQNFQLLAMDFAYDTKDVYLTEVLQQNRQAEREFYQSFAMDINLPIHTKRYSNDVLKGQIIEQTLKTQVPKLYLYARPAINSNYLYDTCKFFNELEFFASELLKIYAIINQWCTSLQLEPLQFTTEQAAFYVIQTLYCVFVYSDTINLLFLGYPIPLNNIDGEELVKLARLCASNVSNARLISDGQMRFFEYYVSLKDIYPCIDIIEQTLFYQIDYLYLVMLCQKRGISKLHNDYLNQIYYINLLKPGLTQLDVFSAYDRQYGMLDFLYHLTFGLEADYLCSKEIARITNEFTALRFRGFFEIDDITFLQFGNQFSRYNLNSQLRRIRYFLTNQDLIQFGHSRIDVPPHLVKYRTFVTRVCHSIEIEYQLRDLEMSALLMLQFSVYSTAIPFILRQLTYCATNGNLIQYAHYGYSVKINIMSPQDLNVFNLAKKQWHELIKQFNEEEHIMAYCNNFNLIKQLNSLYKQLYPLFFKMMNFPYSYYFKLLGYPNMELSYHTVMGGRSTVNYYIIPYVNGQLYPASLIIPRHPMISLNTFPKQSYFYKFIFGTTHYIAPSVGDIIVSHSQIRHRVIIGLKSDAEDLIFRDSLVAPEFNYQLPDVMTKGMMNTIKTILHEDYSSFAEVMLRLVENDVKDDFLSSEAMAFVNGHNYIVNFISLLTLLKMLLDSSTQKSITIVKQKIENKSIFVRCYRLLDIYYAVMNENRVYNANPQITVRIGQLLRDYRVLFKNLEKEIIFKAQLYIQYYEDKSKLESVDYSITALLGNATIQFPLIFYDITTRQIYVTSSNGYSQAPVGNYWIGSASQNLTDKLDPQTYQTLTHMIECYSQNAPIFILDSEYKFYDSYNFFKIIKIYSQYVMRKISMVVISETRFAQQLQLIADFLIYGSIVVVIGAEWLSYSYQLCLSQLSDSISTRNGVFPGLLVPHLDSTEGSQESELKLSLQEAYISYFSDIGQMIFILPHLISCLTTNKFHHVPRYSQEHELNQSFVYECSSTYYAEGSDIYGGDALKAVQEDHLFIGTNTINIYSVMCEVASKMINHFQNYNIVNIYGSSSLHIFELAAGKYAYNFLELASLLRYMGSIAPKMVVFEIPIVLELTKESQSSNMNISTVILLFLMKQLPAVFYEKQEYMEYPELLAKFIGAAFYLQANDIKVLIEYANCMFANYCKALRSIGMRLPNFRENAARFDELFRYKICKCLKSTINDTINKMLYQQVFQTSAILDLLIFEKLIYCRKPLMVVSPRPVYAHFFFNTLCQQTDYHYYWVYTTQQMEDVLGHLQYSKHIKNLIIASIATTDIFMQFQQYIVAFWNNEVLIYDQAHFPFYAQSSHGYSMIPQLIILVNSTLVKECIPLPVITLMTSIYSLLPEISPDYTRRNIVSKFISGAPGRFATYMESESAYCTSDTQVAFSLLLKRQLSCQMALIKNYREYQLQNWKIRNASEIVKILLDFAYYCMYGVLEPEKNIIQAQIYKTLIYQYLYRENVIDITPYEQETDDIDLKSDYFYLMQNYMVELQQLINENYKGTDFSGLFAKININSASFYLLKRQMSYEDRCLRTSCSPNIQQAFERPSVLHRYYYFEPSWPFILDNFLNVTDSAGAVVKIFSIIGAACWSALSNYQLINDRYNRKDRQEKQLEELQKKYKWFVKMLSTVYTENRLLQMQQKRIIGLLGILNDFLENPDEEVLQHLEESDLASILSQVSQESIYYRHCYCAAKELAKMRFPTEHPDNQLVYLWYDGEIKFIEYEIGKGYLADLTLDSENELLQSYIVAYASAINDYISKYYAAGDKNAKCFEPILKTQARTLSVQQIAYNSLPIVIDSRRAAIVQYISAYMFTPYSLFVCGGKYSGKTTLINLAKLANKQLVRYYNASVENISSKQYVDLLLNGILQHFDVDVRNPYANGMRQANLMHKYASYPCVHMNIREDHIAYCDEMIPILITEHSIIGEHYYRITDGIFDFSGYLVFYDMSLIIEVYDADFANRYAIPNLSVPAIDERYSNMLLKAIYRNQDQTQLEYFCNGFSMIRNVLPTALCDSYQLYDCLAAQAATIPYQESRKFDYVFAAGNIHSLLLALKTIPSITDQNIVDVAEQLATLQMLNKLGVMNANSPWADSNIIIYTSTHLIPSLEKDVLEKSLTFPQDSVADMSIVCQKIRDYHKGTNLLITDDSSLVYLPSYILQYVGASSIDSRIFNDYTANYSQILDPIIYYFIYQIFIKLKCKYMRNAAAVECLLNGSGGGSAFPTLDYASCLIWQYLATVGEIAMNNYKTILKSKNPSISFLSTPEYNKHIAIAAGEISQFKNSFSLVDFLSTSCPVFQLKIDNLPFFGYRQAIILMASLLNAVLCDCDMQFPTKSDYNSANYLFDISGIYRLITTSINQKAIATYKQTKTESREFSFLTIMRHSFAQQSEQSKYDFLIILLIIRSCLAICLGINPIYVLPSEKDQHPGHFGFTSQLECDFYFFRQSCGYKLEYQSTDLLYNESDFKVATFKLCKLMNEVEKIEIQNLPKNSFAKEIAKYFFSSGNCTLVLSQMLMDYESNHGISLRTYLNNQLDALSVESGVFTFEELNSIALILSYKNNYAKVITVQDVKVLLCSRLGILVFDDSLYSSYRSAFHDGYYMYLQSLLLNSTINLKQVASELFMQRLARYNLTISSNLQQNLYNSAKNVKLKAPVNLSSQYLLKVQGNFFRIQTEQFLQLYRNSHCNLPNEFVLPQAIALDYTENCNFFAIALISAYKFCTANAYYTYVSIQQFSAFAAHFYNYIMARAVQYLEAIDVLFTVQKYYELLAGPSNSKKYLLQIRQIDFSEFYASIKQVSAQATQNMQLQMSLVEIQLFRDYLYTIIEIVKPSYKRVVAITKAAVFDAVCVAAYLCFNFTGNVSHKYCERWMTENYYFYNYKMIEDKFAQCLLHVLHESGLQVQLNYLKQDGQSKTVIASQAQDEAPLFINNYMQIVYNEIPISYCLKMSGIYWKPGDFAYYALYVAYQYITMGISTFVVDYVIAWPVALYLNLCAQSYIGNRIDYHKYWDHLVDDELLNDDNHELNNYYRETMKYIVIIDLEQYVRLVASYLCQALESTSSIIIFQHLGSAMISQATLTLLRNLLMFRVMETTTKGYQIIIGTLTSSLQQPLHKYPFLFALHYKAHFQLAFDQLEQKEQYFTDKIAIIVDPESYYLDQKYIMQDMFVQSMFGNNCSLRYQKENLLRDYRLIDNNLDRYLTSLKQYLLVVMQDFLENNALTSENLHQIIIYQTVNLSNYPHIVLNTCRRIASITRGKHEKLLSHLFQVSQELIKQLYLVFHEHLTFVQIEEQAIVSKIQFDTVLLYNGNKLASWVSNAIFFAKQVIDNVAVYHVPFSAVFTRDFMNDMHTVLYGELTTFLKENNFGNEDGELLQKLQTDEYILGYAIYYKYSVLAQFITKRVLPLICKRLFAMVPINFAMPFFYLVIIMYLSIIGIIQNSDSANPLSIQQNTIEENTSILEFFELAMDQNKDTHIQMIMYSLLQQFALRTSNAPKIDNYVDLLPKEVTVQKMMQMYWIWIASLQPYNKLMKESQNWFLRHHSSVASLANNKNALLAIIYYQIQQAGVGNPIAAALYNQLQKNGVVQELQYQFASNTNMRPISQLPLVFQLPTPANIFILSILTMAVSQDTIDQQLYLFNTFLFPYTGIDNAFIQQYCSNVGNANNVITSTKPVEITGKILSCIQDSLAMMFDYFGHFYQQNSNEITSDMVSDCLFKIFNIGGRIFMEFRKYQIEYQYNSNAFRGKTAQQPLIFVFHDSNIIPAYYINFAHDLCYASEELSFLKGVPISYQMPTVESLYLGPHIISFPLNDPYHSMIRGVIDLLTKQRLSKNKSKPMYPIYITVSSCSYGYSVQKCPQQLINQKGNGEFLALLSQLYETANPHFCYLDSPTYLHRCFAHYFTLCLCRTHMMLRDYLVNYSKRKTNYLLTSHLYRPSLKGFIFLLLKFSIMIASPNVISDDFQFVKTIDQIIQMNRAAKLQTDQRFDMDIQSIDISILLYSSKNQRQFFYFDEDISELLRYLYLQQIMSLSPFIAGVKQITGFTDEDAPAAADYEADLLPYPSFEKEELDNSSSVTSNNNSSMFSFSETDFNTLNGATKRNKQSFNDYFYKCLTDINKDFGVPIDMDKIKQSITFAMFPKRRLLLYVPYKHFDADVLAGSYDEKMVVAVMKGLQSISSSSADILSVQELYSPISLYEFTKPYYFKTVFSSYALHRVITDYKTNSIVLEGTQCNDFQEMHALFKIFLMSIKLTNYLQYNLKSHYVDPKDLIYRLFPSYLTYNITANGIFNSKGFAAYDNYWEVSALTYGPLLGDMLNFLLVQQISSLNSKSSRLRLVITLEKPQSQPHVLPDGYVDIGKATLHAQQPFYVKICNMELFGACYDFEAQTICDLTPCAQMGYRQFINLYASVALIMNDDYYDEQLRKIRAVTNNDNKVRIPFGYIAVPLSIGGYVRPFVLMRNKTKLSDEYWMQRNVFLGVRYI